jgi:hypothetical protein
MLPDSLCALGSLQRSPLPVSTASARPGIQDRPWIQRAAPQNVFSRLQLKGSPAGSSVRSRHFVASRVGGADFLIFWIFNRRQPAADVKCYSKTRIEKAFFFISCIPLRKWEF